MKRYIVLLYILTLCCGKAFAEEPENQWVPILSASGGSAHLIAAEILRQRYEEEGVSANVMNVTRSECTINANCGAFFTDLWDQAQQRGDIKRQIVLLKFHRIFDLMFYSTAKNTIKDLLISQEPIPNKIICTSPLFLKAVCNAVLEVNEQYNAQITSVDLYNVEPPTDEATYYLRPLKSLSSKQRELIHLYTLPPTKQDKRTFNGDENYWMEKTSLSMGKGQIIYAPAVRPSYLKSENLPKPGEALSFQLKAQKADEERFLKQIAHSYDETSKIAQFDLQANDRVGLIMLGSIPSEQSLLRYVTAALQFDRKEFNGTFKGRNYLFIACGKPDSSTYVKTLNMIHCQFPFTNLTIIPFTAQPISDLLARSDFSITRSGGMTSQEIIALKLNPLRNDPKYICLHAEMYQHDAFSPFATFRHAPLSYFNKLNNMIPPDPALNEEDMIERGIPLWEGGNARYLKSEIPGTKIISPVNFPPLLKKFYFTNESLSVN